MANDPGRKGRALSKSALALALTALVCGCSQEQPSVMTSEPNVPPVNYKTEILAYLRSYLNNPTGVREAFISEPELRTIPAAPPMPATQRYMVCLRFNARDSTGKYEGSRERLVAFLGGRLDTLVPARKEQCASVSWQPFPELEKLTR